MTKEEYQKFDAMTIFQQKQVNAMAGLKKLISDIESQDYWVKIMKKDNKIIYLEMASSLYDLIAANETLKEMNQC